MKLSLFSFFVFNLFFINYAMADVKISTGEWSPFHGAKLKNYGVANELAQTAFERAGHKVEYKFNSWAGVWKALENQKTTAANCAWKREDRLKKFIYPEEPVLENKIVIIRRKNADWSYKDISSLHGKTAASIKGYGYPETFSNSSDIKKREVSNFVAAIRNVMHGKVDFTIEDEYVAKYLIAKELPEARNQIVFETEPPLEISQCYVVFNIEDPKAPALAEELSEQLRAMRSDGTFSKILSSHGID